MGPSQNFLRCGGTLSSHCVRRPRRFLISLVTRIKSRKMSWDGYIDSLIGHSKGSDGVAHVDRVAIFGMNGGALWTSSTHANALKISPSESSKIAANISAAD